MSLSQIYGIQFGSRPNENPLSDSGAWQTVGASGLQILSGVCTGTAAGSAFGEATLNGPTLPQDQYGQFTLGTLSGSGPPDIFLWIRANGTSPAASDGYRRLLLNQNAGSWSVATRISGTPTVLGSGTTTINSGDVFTLEAQGNNVILTQNSTTLFSTTDSTVSSFTNQTFEFNAPFSGDVATITTYAAGTFVSTSISGNAGVAGATVSYTGTASGSTTADGSGNYTISVSNGNYTVTPSLAGYTFSPTSRNETISGSSITNVNFMASATHGWSPVDCRDYASFPNSGVVQSDGSVFYTGQTSSNPGLPPTDSNPALPPTDSRESTPTNSRVNPQE